MRTTIRTKKEAYEVCIKLWDELERKYGKSRKEIYIQAEKMAILAKMGYEDLNSNCPMCQYIRNRINGGCVNNCPLYNCISNGKYGEELTGAGIRKFNRFVKNRLKE